MITAEDHGDRIGDSNALCKASSNNLGCYIQDQNGTVDAALAGRCTEEAISAMDDCCNEDANRLFSSRL